MAQRPPQRQHVAHKTWHIVASGVAWKCVHANGDSISLTLSGKESNYYNNLNQIRIIHIIYYCILFLFPHFGESCVYRISGRWKLIVMLRINCYVTFTTT